MLDLNKAHVVLGPHHFEYSLCAKAGEIHAILGRSGSGKSTLLNVIAGFIACKSGDVRWNNESLLARPPESRPVSSLFQSDNLFDHLTVWQNIALGVDPGLRLNKDDEQRLSAVLARVGLDGYEQRKPAQLSGGQQQRVALARCLLRQRPILLLDEPFSALDDETRSSMQDLTLDIIQEEQLCVLMVTHAESDAAAMNASIWRMTDGVLSAE